MFVRTPEEKVLRDPVHGYIHVQDEVIWKCINTRWFQRMRRIHQLGGAFMVYHTADHTRFAHSLGVYEIVRRMITEVPDLREALNEREKMTVMLAGLLHDIGHGPFSHAFEQVSNISHEYYTCKIIEEDPEISGILESAAEGLAKEVADVIRHKHPNTILTQIVSAQLDADRMDYLLRDAYFTGTTYGEYDLARLLRTLRVSGDRIVIKESGVYAVENYIMARYHMYWQVYYHPVARSYENLVNKLFLRLKDLMDEGKIVAGAELFLPVLQGREMTLEEYYPLDEYACTYTFSLLEKSDDPILRDLSCRVLNRHLFAYRANTRGNIRSVKAALKRAGYDPRYYLVTDTVGQAPYVPYRGDSGKVIWIRTHNGDVRELSKASGLVASLVKGPKLSDDRIFYPAEIE